MTGSTKMNYLRKERLIRNQTNTTVSHPEMDLEENPLNNLFPKEHHQDPQLWKKDENRNLPVMARPDRKVPETLTLLHLNFW